MDYATIYKLMESNGYRKTNTINSLLTFETTFSKNNEKILVHWAMGGYVSSIVVSVSNDSTIVYDSAEGFVETFV